MKPTILIAQLATIVFAECDFTGPEKEADVTPEQIERIIRRVIPFLMEVASDPDSFA